MKRFIPFDPRMMSLVWIYAYMLGMKSSRRVARALVKLESVAIDGTKIKAYASKRKAMSCRRMDTRDASLKREIDAYFDAVAEQDRIEDEKYGPDGDGMRLPPELWDAKVRREKIAQAKRELERRAVERKAKEQEKRVHSAWTLREIRFRHAASAVPPNVALLKPSHMQLPDAATRSKREPAELAPHPAPSANLDPSTCAGDCSSLGCRARYSSASSSAARKPHPG